MKVLAVVLVALASLMCVTAVFAHAQPATIKPGDKAVVTSPPASIDMEMSQEMARNEGAYGIHVLDAAGKEVTTTAAVIDNGNRRRLSVAMPSSLAPGAYTVNWKTLSADDGDPADGQFSFTYNPGGKADPGQERVREELAGAASPAATASSPAPAALAPSVDADGGGTSWVLVIAVAVGMFVAGSGTTFLLVQRAP